MRASVTLTYGIHLMKLKVIKKNNNKFGNSKQKYKEIYPMHEDGRGKFNGST